MTKEQLKLLEHIMKFEAKRKRLPTIGELSEHCGYGVKPIFLKSVMGDYPEELTWTESEKEIFELMELGYKLHEIVEKTGKAYTNVYRIVKKFKPFSKNNNLREYPRDEKRHYTQEITDPLYIEVQTNNKKYNFLNGCRGYAGFGGKKAKCKIWKNCKEYNIELYDNEFIIIEPVNVKLHKALKIRPLIMP